MPENASGEIGDRAGDGFGVDNSSEVCRCEGRIGRQNPGFFENLKRIVLAVHRDDSDGFYEFYRREETGAIFLNAWRDDLWIDLQTTYFDAHQGIFERLGLSHDRLDDRVACRFTEAQARAFMLLHVFMHELGHHHDSIHQKHWGSSKGEDYAEKFATSRFEQLFPRYVRVFGHPGRGQPQR